MKRQNSRHGSFQLLGSYRRKHLGSGTNIVCLYYRLRDAEAGMRQSDVRRLFFLRHGHGWTGFWKDLVGIVKVSSGSAFLYIIKKYM
jgi:hypothetical protein